jgi:hypothetical protein
MLMPRSAQRVSRYRIGRGGSRFFQFDSREDCLMFSSKLVVVALWLAAVLASSSLLSPR